MIIIDLMITVESVQVPNKDKKSKISIKCVLFIFVLLVGSLTFAIFWLGKPKQHEIVNHKLYGVFDKSA